MDGGCLDDAPPHRAPVPGKQPRRRGRRNRAAVHPVISDPPTDLDAPHACDRTEGLFRWHDFRHYAVSVLISQHADILLLARIAGHSDPNVTLNVYGHLMKGALFEAAELYDPLATGAVR
jgi:integrase